MAQADAELPGIAAVPDTFGVIALSIRPSWHTVAYTIVLAVASVFAFGLIRALSSSLHRERRGAA